MFVLLSVEIGYQPGTNISRKSASVSVSGWLPLQLHMNVICYCFQACPLTVCDMIVPLFLFIFLQLCAQDNMTVLYIVRMAINRMSTDFIVIKKRTCLLFNPHIYLVRFFVPKTLWILRICNLNTHSIRIIIKIILLFFFNFGDFSNKSSRSLWFMRCGVFSLI
jgi:hypothetical protein